MNDRAVGVGICITPCRSSSGTLSSTTLSISSTNYPCTRGSICRISFNSIGIQVALLVVPVVVLVGGIVVVVKVVKQYNIQISAMPTAGTKD